MIRNHPPMILIKEDEEATQPATQSIPHLIITIFSCNFGSQLFFQNCILESEIIFNPTPFLFKIYLINFKKQNKCSRH